MDYENLSICTACGGKCCKHLPGEIYPSDLEHGQGVMEEVKRMLDTGLYCFDWWEGDPRCPVIDYEDKDYVSRGYYLRPVTKGKIGKPFDASWGGVCVFLQSSGCKFPLDQRPAGCRNLEPATDGCIAHIDKRDAAIAWLPYHEEISIEYHRRLYCETK